MSAKPTSALLLWLDTAICVTAALPSLLAAVDLEAALGLPAILLRLIGAALLPAALFAALAAVRIGHGHGLAWAVVALNTSWVVISLTMLLTGWTTPLGTQVVIWQAAMVAALASAQTLSLRRSRTAAPQPAA